MFICLDEVPLNWTNTPTQEFGSLQSHSESACGSQKTGPILSAMSVKRHLALKISILLSGVFQMHVVMNRGSMGQGIVSMFTRLESCSTLLFFACWQNGLFTWLVFHSSLCVLLLLLYSCQFGESKRTNSMTSGSEFYGMMSGGLIL